MYTCSILVLPRRASAVPSSLHASEALCTCNFIPSSTGWCSAVSAGAAASSAGGATTADFSLSPAAHQDQQVARELRLCTRVYVHSQNGFLLQTDNTRPFTGLKSNPADLQQETHGLSSCVGHMLRMKESSYGSEEEKTLLTKEKNTRMWRFITGAHKSPETRESFNSSEKKSTLQHLC